MSVKSFGNPSSSFRYRFGRTGNRASKPFGGFISATGGTTSTPGNGYKYHYFTHPGGAYPLSPSPQSFVVTSGSNTIDVLLVAGGGGGGSDAGGGGGGGQGPGSGSPPLGTGASGGIGGGGFGGNDGPFISSPIPQNALQSTGGGGGGGGNNTVPYKIASGNGGSGIVLIAYPS